MILKQNVGIDVSMDTFDVNLSTLDNSFKKHCLGTKKFNNDNEDFNKLIQWIGKHKSNEVEISFTMEFTGVYYEQLAYFLKANQYVVYMVIPSKSKN
jgi:transposase